MDYIFDSWTTEELEKLLFAPDRLAEFGSQHKNDPFRDLQYLKLKVLLNQLEVMQRGNVPSKEIYDKMIEALERQYDSTAKRTGELTHNLLSLSAASHAEASEYVERIRSILSVYVSSYNPPIVDASTVRRDDAYAHVYDVPPINEVLSEPDYVQSHFVHYLLATFDANKLSSNGGSSKFDALCRAATRTDFMPDAAFVDLLATDFKQCKQNKWRHRTWGDNPIHNLMTISQLDLVSASIPQLLEDHQFISQYVGRLRPSPETPLRRLPEDVKDAYFQHLLKFARRLGNDCRNYAIHIYFFVLQELARERRYDFELLQELLTIAQPRIREHLTVWDLLRSVSRDVSSLPVVNISVIDHYLDYFIRCEPNDSTIRSVFEKSLGETELANRIARVRLRHNMIQPLDTVVAASSTSSAPLGFTVATSVTSTTAALPLPAKAAEAFLEKYKATVLPHVISNLYDEEYLRWASEEDNKTVFEVNEEVVLYALAKKIKEINVRLYRIDSEARLKKLLQDGRLSESAAEEVGTIDLAGLVPHLEGSINLSEFSPYSETCVKVSIPALVGKRGEFIVELMAEGVSTRALVRKGYVPFLEQPTKLGHVFGIFTEDNKPAVGFISMGKQTFHSDPKSGYIVVPYAESDRDEAILITRTGRLEASRVSSPSSGSSGTPTNAKSSQTLASKRGILSSVFGGRGVSTAGFKPAFANVEVRLEALSTSCDAAMSSTAPEESKVSAALEEASQDRFTTVATFHRRGITYNFNAGFFVERETVLQRVMAQVLVYATLTLNSQPLPLSTVQDLQLILQTCDAENVTSTQSISGPSLRFNDAGEASHEFRVPENLINLTVTLSGKIRNPITGTDQRVSESKQFQFNDNINTSVSHPLTYQPDAKGIAGCDRAGLYLYRLPNGDCQVYVLGLGGEPMEYSRLNIVVRHLASRRELLNGLQTDKHGKITIRSTQLVDSISVHSNSVGSRTWSLSAFGAPRVVVPDTVCVEQGRIVRVPYVGSANAVEPLEVSFIEVADQMTIQNSERPTPIRSVLSAVTLDSTSRHIIVNTENLIPGTYLLRVDGLTPDRDVHMKIQVVKGTRVMDFVLSEGVLTQLSPATNNALQIASITGTGVGKMHTLTQWGAGGFTSQAASSPSSYYSGVASTTTTAVSSSTTSDKIRIKLSNATEMTKVTVMATFFAPDTTYFDQAYASVQIVKRALKSHLIIKPRAKLYQPQTLGSEHRYILNRRTVVKSVGNMLPRPTLLLSKRFVRNTSLAEDPKLMATSAVVGGLSREAEEESRYKSAKRKQATRSGSERARSSRSYHGTPSNSTLEFLAHPAKVLLNLHPDANGVVEIDRSVLSDYHSFLSIFVNNTNDVMSIVGATVAITPKRVPTFIEMVDETKQSETKENKESSTSAGYVTAFRDCRLISSLNPEKHYTEQYLSTCLKRGESIVVPDIQSSKVEVFTSLQDALRILFALNPSLSPAMADFSFLLRWNQLSEEEKRSKFNQYISHELNLFIYFKDRDFFKRIVRPHINNKVRRTLIDLYLLGEDMSAYVASNAFASLNSLEKILLGERIGAAEASAIKRLTSDLAPAKNLALYSTLFKSALRGRELDEPSDRDVQPQSSRSTEAMDSYSAFGSAPCPPPPPPQAPPAPMGGAMNLAFSARAAPMKSARPQMQMQMQAQALESSIQTFGGSSRRMMAAPVSASAPAPEMDFLAPAECEEDRMCYDESDQDDDDYPTLGGRFEDAALAASASLQAPRESYRSPETTKEYEERDYYNASLNQAVGLVPFNDFWADYAAYVEAHPSRDVPFLTSNFLYATSCMTEAIFALAVLDLPLNEASIEARYTIDCPINQPTWKLTAGSSCIVFHQELRETQISASTSVSVTQNYFDPADPITREDGENVAKIVTQFLPGRVYSCRVAVTNVAPFEQRCGVLLQPPTGSIGLKVDRSSQGQEMQVLVLKTRNEFITLQPYSTTVLAYSFYFPLTGSFDHYPAHVCKNTRTGTTILGHGEARAGDRKLRVLPQLDAAAEAKSWLWIAAKSSLEELTAFLRDENLNQFPGYNIQHLYWRCNDAAAWQAIYKTLRAKRSDLPLPFLIFVFKHWKQVDSSIAYEAFGNWFVGQRYLSTRFFYARNVVNIDIADTWAARSYGKSISHLEYLPLLCARVHQLTVGEGSGRRTTKRAEIQNLQLRETYDNALRYLVSRFTSLEETSTAWLLTLSYLLLLQERIQEAYSTFEIARRKVDAESKSSEADVSLRLQVDYMNVYFKFFQPTVPIEEVRAIITKYRNYPVKFWRSLFTEVESQLSEIEGHEDDMLGETGRSVVVEEANLALQRGDYLVDNAEIKDVEVINRARALDSLAMTEPTLEATLERSSIVVSHQNVTSLKVKFFPMDIEFLFSSEPFLKSGSSKFVDVAANETITQVVPPTFGETRIEIPDKFKTKNLTIQVSSEGVGKVSTLTYFPCQMNVQVIEAFGQVKVTRRRAGSDHHIPVPLVYVKCYAKLKNGSVDFYKDGYTDHRGRFDFVSLSSNKLESTERFALLVSSPEYGSFVCEAGKP